MMLFKRPGLAQSAPRSHPLLRGAGRIAWGIACVFVAAPWAMAQTTFNYTGALQTYTVPAGAGGVTIQANGAGGGSGGNDLNGDGGAGGAGARAVGTYYIAPGTVLNVAVGQGGRAGNTSQGAFTCANAAGAGGLAGGAPPGWAGGSGGQPGCSGWSGGGAGGGAASVVATAANARLLVAGGGGGGQGGALQIGGRAGLAATTVIGTLPGAAGTAGTTRVGDGSGGGGGGGGCAAGVGGAELVDSSATNNTVQATGGGSCRDTTLVSAFSVTASLGGAGGASVTGVAPASGNPGGNGSVTITPIYPTLTVSKSQPSPALQVGINSVYSLTVATTTTTPAFVARVVDQLPVNMTYISSSGTGWTCSTAANAGGTLVTCDFVGTIGASGGTSVLQITARPTSNITVTNYTAVDPAGGTSPPTSTTCTAANTPTAGCAAPVVSTVALGFGGNVYSDPNHNGNLDAGESGIGGASALWVKLVPRTGSVCNGPATVAVSVTLSTGAYSFTNIQQGNYCLVVDDNNTLSDITAAYPAGFIGTQNPTGVIQFSIVGAPPVPQNFGLYSGSTLSGNVFADNGAGGGTANNGVKAGTEAGLAGITVNAMQGAATVDSELTASDGSFILWVPAVTSGTVVITPVLPAGYTATGGSAGTTAAATPAPA
jgi:hypothetical protein